MRVSERTLPEWRYPSNPPVVVVRFPTTPPCCGRRVVSDHGARKPVPGAEVAALEGASLIASCLECEPVR